MSGDDVAAMYQRHARAKRLDEALSCVFCILLSAAIAAALITGSF